MKQDKPLVNHTIIPNELIRDLENENALPIPLGVIPPELENAIGIDIIKERN